LKILYCASDQTVPGTTGGSVHVAAVANGLAALGHEVHVLITPGTGSETEGAVSKGASPSGRAYWIPMPPPMRRKEFRWMLTTRVRELAARIRPDVIMERYYNFAGEGMAIAAETGAIAVLEVNAPVVDYPGSMKRILDRALLGEPMRRRRERMCAQADIIVTPAPAILPEVVPDGKILRLEWGADTDLFRPDASGPIPFSRPAETVAVFAGAFRAWHGAIHLADAMRELRARGRHDVGAVFIGDGPELPAVRRAAGALDGVVFTGALPHAHLPACLAACDIGVAPFDVDAHRALSLGFYWSPLKIFEYMAAGLPVVAPVAARIPSIVEHDREGLLYDPAFPHSLTATLEALTDKRLRLRLGHAGRARAVRDYSWSAHCAALDAAMKRIGESRGGTRE
jgi:glycosyltransferase involved in cell wall biosynthesis